MIFNQLWRHCRKTFSRVFENAWKLLFILMAALYVLGRVAMLYAGEEDIVNNYTWWFIVTVTTVGYGDYFPTSTLSRLIAGIIMMFGIGAIGIVIGKISEAIVSFASISRKGLRRMKHENHTVIMGYRSGSTEKVVSELRANNPNEKLVLCSFSQKENPVFNDEVDFVTGELASADVMSRANVKACRNVIIHGADDNETFITAFEFRSINTTAHMVCYLNNDDHYSKISSLNADSTSLNQVILPANVYLMAQELQDRESSGVVQQLISNIDGENLYRLDLPGNCKPVEFQSVFFGMKIKYSATVLAVKDTVLNVNPKLSFIVKPGMALFYTAPERLVNVDLTDIGDYK